MAKVEDVLAKVQSMGYGIDTEDAQIKAVNSAHRRLINARRWTFTLTNSSPETVSGNENVAWTGQRIDAIRMEKGTNFTLLEHLDLPDLRDLIFTNRTTGSPRYWAQQGDNILLWPIPDGVYKLAVATVEAPKTLTAKTDELQIPDSHVDILAYAVVIDLSFRERDWDAHNFSRQMYAELYMEMLSQYGMTDRQTTKHVAESGWYDDYEPDRDPAWLTFG
jgi:hypothetical protein